MNPTGFFPRSSYSHDSSPTASHGTRLYLAGFSLLATLLFFCSSAFAQTTLTPATLAFGNQAVGVTSAAKIATFKNTQTVPLTISTIAIFGSDAADYAWVGGTCALSPNTLGAGKSCTITVTFTPSALESRTATLTVTDTVSTSPQSIALTGTGVAPVTLLPASLAFGNEYEGATSATKTLTLKNVQATAPLTITSIGSSGANAADFSMAGGTCPSSPETLGASKSCTITVSFSPSAAGSRTASLIVTDNASSNPPAITLTGTGLAPATVAPTTLTFASLLVGTTSAAKTVTLANHLSTALAVSSVSASGDFAVSSNGCASGVSAGGKCTIGVTFTPTAIGSRQGTITIDNVGLGSPILVTLSGTGNDTGLTSITVTPANPSVVAGTTQQFTATGHYTKGAMENLTPFVTWNSLTSGVATITTGGLATGVTTGSSTISAMLGSVTGSTTLTVTPPVLVSIAVTPANPSVLLGSNEQFTATGTYTDNSTLNLTTAATWSSSVMNVATISAAGLASTVGPGQTTVQASVNGINGSTTLTVTANFVPTGSMNTARFYHTATQLNNADVLVVGGFANSSISGVGSGPLASAELYNPATASFAPTGSLNTARSEQTATLLSNGMVLIAGGYDSNGNPLASAELYNPTTATFISTGSLNVPRYNHTATLLANGTVLVAGGTSGNGSVVASAELYNPTTGTFTSTGSLNTARAYHSATLLNNGTVLIAGGFNTGIFGLNSAEIYNPLTGTFTATGNMTSGHAFHSATLLNNGGVLIAGGVDSNANPSASAELYDPSTGTFNSTGGMSTPRLWHTATLVSNGTVLVAGGSQGTQCCILTSIEVFDPALGAFSLAGNLTSGRVFQSAVFLTTREVLVAGGLSGGNFDSSNPPFAVPLASAELYEPATLTPANLVSIAIAPASPTIPLDTSQQFVATGTFSDNSTEQLASVSWSSSNSAVATISNDSTNLGNAYGVAQGTTNMSACAGAVCGSATLTVGAPALVSIAVSPANGTVAAGLTVQFHATGTYTDNSTQDLTSLVTWNSSSPVATINSGGLASGVITGATTITATLGSVSGMTTLTVSSAVLASISVTPMNPSIAAGNMQQFTATGMYSDGTTQNLTSAVAWSSMPASVATIAPGGLATAMMTGSSTIGATMSGITGTTTLTVTAPVLVSIAVTPANPSIALGITQQFTATGTYSDGSTQNLAGTVTWSSSALGVATISTMGLASAVGAGQTTIEATSGAINGSTTFTVAAGFILTGSLNSARQSPTATLLNNGMVLITGGYGSSGALASAELYNPATGTFTPTGSLNTARYEHTATLLNDGMVLIAGGETLSGTAALASAELYNPATGTFTPTGSLKTARFDHTATLLNNGMVLIAGGGSYSFASASAELYDPAAGTFTATGSLNTARFIHTATLLNNGMVLVAGGLGSSGTALASAELYNPLTQIFTPTGNLNATRFAHTATLLNNGMVLIAGGGSSIGALASAELYNPATGIFTFTSSLNTSRYYHTGTLLNDGTVLFAGGVSSINAAISGAEVYNSATGTFTLTGNLNVARYVHTATALNNGTVLVAGGYGSSSVLASAELYESGTLTPQNLVSIDITPATATVAPGETQQFIAIGTFSDTSTEQLASVTWSSSDTTTATITNDVTNPGTAMVVGSPSVSTPVTITAAAGTISGSATLTARPTGFISTGSLNTARAYHTATLLNNGMVLVAGGYLGTALTDVELYNPATGIFAATGSLNTARYQHTATLLNNGIVLITGGQGSNSSDAGILASAELYNPATGTFTTTGSLNTARVDHTATLLNNGMVLIAGGVNTNGTYVSSAELYNPSTGTFSVTSSLNEARILHTATLLNNGMVLITGGYNNGSYLSSAELYNPSTQTFTLTGSLNIARRTHTATLLNNGMVLIGSGQGSNGYLASAELYNPSTEIFTLTGSLNVARAYHTATLLNNGMVLITGGYNNGSYLSSAELYNPLNATFTVTNSLNNARFIHTATLLNNGMVLIVGGENSGGPLASAELY
jgi:Bacterial Ig-like domain (group 2)/Galactose oxidase, central domain/Kelch motif